MFGKLQTGFRKVTNIRLTADTVDRYESFFLVYFYCFKINKNNNFKMYKVSKSIRAICGQHIGAYIVPESQITHSAVDFVNLCLEDKNRCCLVETKQ
jgi:hypothetical protein